MQKCDFCVSFFMLEIFNINHHITNAYVHYAYQIVVYIF